METTANIMRNSASTFDGWTKLTKDNDTFRKIRIGNSVNCNEDELICNYEIKKNIEDILKNHDIVNYSIQNIHTKHEFSYELLLKEEIYNKLKKKL